jgi:FkbM family methyltransferase
MSQQIPTLHWLFARYLRSRDHPAKLRIINWVRQLLKLEVLIAETKVGLMRLNINDLVQTNLFFHGLYEPQTVELITRLLAKGDCFVDVGANVGQYSLAAAGCVGREGCVVAIEPNPENCVDLLMNRRLNDYLEIIQVVTTAADEKESLLSFALPPPSNRGASREINRNITSDDDLYLVPGFRLTEIVGALSIRRIDVVKIDVEGSELRVLKGLLEQRSVPHPKHIVFEFIPEHFSYGGSPIELLKYLEDRKYEILTIVGDRYRFGEPIPEENLWARQRPT